MQVSTRPPGSPHTSGHIKCVPRGWRGWRC
jgi:hypothetical protein